MILRDTLHVLYFYISTSLRMCAVSSMAVCCSPLMFCFPCMLLRYCLNDNEMVPVDHIFTGKGKAIPLQAWTSTGGFQELEARIFQDNRHMKVVGLSALRTGRIYPPHPRKYSWYSFLLEAESTEGHSAAGMNLLLVTLLVLHYTCTVFIL